MIGSPKKNQQKGKSIPTGPDVFEQKMIAVVKFAPGVDGIELRELAIPQPGEGEAVLKVLVAGICGTDIHIAKDEYSHQTPVVMGHEILGIVEKVGSKADRLWLGKKVAVETYFSACEKCPVCRAGRRNLCPDRRSIGSIRDGGFAEYVLVPSLNLHEVPDSATSFDGVFAEPLACVTNCLLDPPRIQPGDNVLVTGPGTMGQLAAQVARAAGANVTLLGLETDRNRLGIASEIGLDTLIGDPPGDTYDVVIECSGNRSAAAAALRAAKRGGTYIQVGIFGQDICLPFDLVLLKELTISSGFASTPTSWIRAIELLRGGELSLHPLITKTVELKDFSEAFACVAEGNGVKTLIAPGTWTVE